MKLDLKKFSELNRNRAAEGFKTYKNVPITYWTTALAGEVGELCNMIKKMERVSHGGIDGGSTYTAANIKTSDLEEEIGGIGIYLDLLAGLLGISMEEAIIKTFNSKSDKYKFTQYITDENIDAEGGKDVGKWDANIIANRLNTIIEKLQIHHFRLNKKYPSDIDLGIIGQVIIVELKNIKRELSNEQHDLGRK